MQNESVKVDTIGEIMVVTIDRPEVRNAVDGPTAIALHEAFAAFDADDGLAVAVLTGAGNTFCAGADLKAVATGRGNKITAPEEGFMHSLGPMGPSRMELSKPVVAAVEGHAVAGGLELAVWCDLRVAADDATFGVYCRRWGVPLVDGGTVRLPQLVGTSRAMDMVLTGRGVDASEALEMGLVNRVVESGTALAEAIELAKAIASFPQQCVRSDLASLRHQHGRSTEAALRYEVEVGLATVRSGETRAGATRFAEGAGRHGRF